MDQNAIWPICTAPNRQDFEPINSEEIWHLTTNEAEVDIDSDVDVDNDADDVDDVGDRLKNRQ